MFASEDHVDLPCVDLLTWTFGNNDYDQKNPVWIDAYDESNRITASEAKSKVRRMIGGLRKHGLKLNDSVCVHSYNNMWYPIVYLAIIGTGGRFVGSNPAYKPFELERLLKLSKTKYLVVEPSLISSIWLSAIESGISQANIFLFDIQEEKISTSTRLSSLKVLMQHEEEDWHCFNDQDLARKTPATLQMTSGTGGLPKAAVMSHYAILAQAALASYTAEHVPYQVKRLISLPFFHSFVLPFHVIAIRRGEPTYIMPRFHAEDCADFIDRYQITTIPLVPPIALLLFTPPFSTSYSFSSLREIICAGSPLGPDVQSQLVTKLGKDTRFYQLWGMSELGWVTLSRYPERGNAGSSGRLLPNTCARLVDAEGSEISEERRPGEILIKNSGTMSGYLGDSQATDASFTDGWFKTGDIGYCHQGNWYIVDRIKDLIKVRGWQVSPAEVEACLLLNPHVKDAAVIGVAASGAGDEIPRAYIVLESIHMSNLVSEREIQAYVRQQLASYKALEGGVKFVQCIPRTVSGKILRRILREKSYLES